MPMPPPRAPTFPSFVDDVQEIDDTEFLDDDIPVKSVIETDLPPSSTLPSNVVKMSSPQPTPDLPNGSAPNSVPYKPLRFAQSKSRIRSVLLWTDPKLTGLIFAASMLFFYLTLIRHLSVLSVFGLLSGTYLVAGLAIVNINKHTGGKLDTYIKRPSSETPLFRPESINRWSQTMLEEGNEAGEDIRDILYCDKLDVTLRWIGIALVVYLAGMYFSMVTVFLVLTLIAFTLPLAYEKNKKQVDEAAARATDAASKYIETGRQAATEKAVQWRDVAASRSAPYLEKAPPAAKDMFGKIGLMPQKKSQ